MKDLFKNSSKPNNLEAKDVSAKPPVNIFSKPVNVHQTEAGRKSRLKGVIIEGLLFGAFLTAITAIYSISGIELKMDPTAEVNSPSIWYFLLEFVIFSGLVGTGDYFLTEKRVNEYNQKVAGIAFNIDEEIEKALEEQKQEGMTEKEVAALNKTNGEESDGAEIATEAQVNIEIKDVDSAEYDADKAFEAYDGTNKLAEMLCCKAVLLDAMGIEHEILKISAINTYDEKSEKLASKLLLAHSKETAFAENYLAIVTSKVLNDKYAFGMYDTEKYKIESEFTDENPITICESYPGSLMGVSGKITKR